MLLLATCVLATATSGEMDSASATEATRTNVAAVVVLGALAAAPLPLLIDGVTGADGQLGIAVLAAAAIGGTGTLVSAGCLVLGGAMGEGGHDGSRRGSPLWA